MDTKIWHKLAHIDRRILWGLQVLLMAVVLLRPIGLPIPVGGQTQDMYDFYESLPEGSIVYFEYGYDPSGEHELSPMVAAMLHHAFQRGLRVVSGGLWTFGPTLGQQIYEEIAPLYDVEYGVDFVNLGFNPGGQILAMAMVDDLWTAVRGVDIEGTRLEDLSLMHEVPRLTADYVAAICVFSEGSPGTVDWLHAVTEPTGIPLTAGTITMLVPEAATYLDAGQYRAIIPGNRGAAEYEFLVGAPGPAIAGQDVLSAMSVYLWLLIIVGNIAFVKMSKRR